MRAIGFYALVGMASFAGVYALAGQGSGGLRLNSLADSQHDRTVFPAGSIMTDGAGMPGVHASEAGCVIKGNISIGSGEHIYHVPGQEHYDETKISPQYGERWFCSEAEAMAAGWRRAKR